jgi:hypothetical protein
VVTRDTDVTINAFFKHSRVKQYLKDGRALRIETVVNAPNDLRCQRRLRNLGELQAKARDVNTRLLDTERVGQGCVLASPALPVPACQRNQPGLSRSDGFLIRWGACLIVLPAPGSCPVPVAARTGQGARERSPVGNTA